MSAFVAGGDYGIHWQSRGLLRDLLARQTATESHASLIKTIHVRDEDGINC